MAQAVPSAGTPGGRLPLPLQRRGAWDAGATAGVEEGTARRLRRGLEHQVHRAFPLRGPARPERLEFQRGRAEGVAGGDPAGGVMKWQHRLNWLQMRLASGCHLDRDVRALVTAQPFAAVKVDEFDIDKAPR